MGRKYLGAHFDIHGGGLDLTFPHHECEIAQAVASQGEPMVKYWMHNNMITVDGKKMAKSAGNFITLEEFFTGDHPALEQAYAPMTIRFFVLSAHYRGTVDFSNSALQAAEKGYQRLMDADAKLQSLKPSATSTIEKIDLAERCKEAMDDDINTPMVIAALFDAARLINSIHDGHEQITSEQLEELRSAYDLYLHDILGMQSATETADLSGSQQEAFAGAMDLLLEIRAKAKASKDWETSDLIRDKLTALGFEIQDTKSGAEWKVL